MPYKRFFAPRYRFCFTPKNTKNQPNRFVHSFRVCLGLGVSDARRSAALLHLSPSFNFFLVCLLFLRLFGFFRGRFLRRLFRFRLVRLLCLLRRCLFPAALPRVVRHIPSRSLELDRRRRLQPLHLPAAVRALFQVRPRDALDLLRTPLALGALIFVQWHSRTSH